MENDMMPDLQSTLVSLPPAERVRAYFTQADETAVYRTLPRYLATQLGLDERTTLTLLAQAMFNGVVELNWEIECPMCKGHMDYALTRAQHIATCPMCGSFEAELDQNILVTFSAHPGLRALSPQADNLEWRGTLLTQYGPTSGHELLTVQAFRDWAQGEPLPPGESLNVKRITVMFTDLGGSTALYARKGDPRAFGLVREHYNVLFNAINTGGGAVVKTIGDSVMGVFSAAVRGVRAAIQAQQEIAQFNQSRALPADEALLLKVGLHTGACISVNLNDRLDYFGSTVNIAARIKDLAHAGEVVFTSVTSAEPAVQELMQDQTVECAQTKVKGLDTPLDICRLKVGE
jgi:class 3 adenylate cyclase